MSPSATDEGWYSPKRPYSTLVKDRVRIWSAISNLFLLLLLSFITRTNRSFVEPPHIPTWLKCFLVPLILTAKRRQTSKVLNLETVHYRGLSGYDNLQILSNGIWTLSHDNAEKCWSAKWLTQLDFGQPYSCFVWRMADGRQLLLALLTYSEQQDL